MSRLSVFAASLMFAVASTVLLGETTPTILSAMAQTTTNQQRKAEADRLLQQAVQQYRQSQFREALGNLEQALVIYREVGDRKGEGTTLNNIGTVYGKLGEYPKALDFFQQALAIRRQVGDKAGEGWTLDNIGSVYDNLGEYPKALDFYQQALAIRRQVGDKAGEGTTLNNIGFLLNKQNQPELAIPPDTTNTPILGLGLSNKVAGFEPLPNVIGELNAIVHDTKKNQSGIYPGLILLNNDFNFSNFRDRLSGKKILHIATHGEFVAGKPEDSYLVLGTGEKLPISQIKDLVSFGLTDVHLVVLSACETALGGADAEGLEISGISAYFLEGGAKAAIASLWQVNDASTSLLMETFYNQLAHNTAESPITKAAALRNAQLTLLRGNNRDSTTKENRATVSFEIKPAAPVNHSSQFSHPYYWAPFVLIGNGL